MGNKNSRRQELLTAASDIVQIEGVERLTLERVADKAGVSKGGLLYHFPTKEALIKGMVEELTNRYMDELQDLVDADEDSHGRWSRAYVKATTKELNDGLQMSEGLLAAMFTNPELLKNWRKHYNQWQENIENDNDDPVYPTIARLAMDGLWFAELFGLAPLKKELKEKVLAEVLSWTKET
ncbi:TetR family transcriptional regulator [Virgibacillus kekensis]|uniref:TetR family transcriptional regulator n=1 Tax=Virgibacillus kekensis TaxID=202261 RepID=A0ABV9DP46_9BACI